MAKWCNTLKSVEGLCLRSKRLRLVSEQRRKDRGTVFSVLAAREKEPQVAQAHYESPEQHYPLGN